MKTLRILTMILIAGFLFSCEKDIEKDQVKQDVIFGITHLDPNELKTDNDDGVICPDDIHPVYAEIDIRDKDDLVTTYIPEVFYLNGQLFTQAIRLESGNYTVEKFIIYNIDDIPIMATPNADSDYAVYVEQTVEFPINVGEFTKIEVPVEVLCFVPGAYMNFGFFWFNIEEIIVKNICFFGDLCIKDIEPYLDSKYYDVFGEDIHNYPFDLPAIFKVETFVWENEAWKSLKVFENVDKDNNLISPMCAEYFINKKGDAREFKFNLYVWVPTADGFDWAPYDSWTFMNTDEEKIMVNEFNVVEFVIGNCSYNVDGVHVYPPLQILPETANVTINHPGDPGYWNLTINSVYPLSDYYDLPVGSYTGWCADENTTIGNNSTWTMYIYGTLNDIGWPAVFSGLVDFEKITKVNWLISNLGMFDGFNTPTGMYITTDDMTQAQGEIIQQAIWGILQDKNVSGIANTMKTMANQYGASFKPLPGQWTAILMLPVDDDDEDFDPDNLTYNWQLIFTMVDP